MFEVMFDLTSIMSLMIILLKISCWVRKGKYFENKWIYDEDMGKSMLFWFIDLLCIGYRPNNVQLRHSNLFILSVYCA